MKVLDCGCGPGIITCDIADRIPNGRVVGIDADESQVALASRNAEARSIPNVEFRSANVYDLPFPSDSFDSIFLHAVLEHLRNPNKAVEEFHRLLKAGGILGVCSPDWGGFLLAPLSNQLTAASDAYKDLQIANGGDVYVGRKFSSLLERIGFEDIVMHARYEVYESLEFIGEYLAVQIEDSGETVHASTLREWSAGSSGMFAQAWVSCIGRKPR